MVGGWLRQKEPTLKNHIEICQKERWGIRPYQTDHIDRKFYCNDRSFKSLLILAQKILVCHWNIYCFQYIFGSYLACFFTLHFVLDVSLAWQRWLVANWVENQKEPLNAMFCFWAANDGEEILQSSFETGNCISVDIRLVLILHYSHLCHVKQVYLSVQFSMEF